MSNKSSFGPILVATVTVSDIEESLNLYTKTLGYYLDCRGLVSSELAKSWKTNKMVNSEWALLKPKSKEFGWIRLIEGKIPKSFRPLGHYGWSAIEILVESPDDVYNKLLKSDFKIIGKPEPLISSPKIKAMQAMGLDGEVFYITNVPKGASPIHNLPKLKSKVDRVFIMVLASSDLKATHQQFSELFNISKLTEKKRGKNFVGKNYGLVVNNESLKMTTMQLKGECLIQVDTLPDSASFTPNLQGYLPPGIPIVTFIVRNLDLSIFSDNEMIHEKSSFYEGRGSKTIIGSSGERIELIDFS